ncbi:hypothetical protein P153DRAFT_359900 [Dothidotthia symphoricarpi CBS 119687]|uniref:Zn(2)-C6 fungal-type domain-containing protein n=1 Tax=Dothidotthia symphoricarpi CBS 119687 TaxID=1392245 RepID=A0A6A6A6K5_9PLEO|nr:uncharacterized protein P153DRAFT_359900 [Dothidotthia symphoricarpi CBS 119687]KAF2126251.1 hypothetical protein P153DRAFT_359900 [Dothidotthia symphoricarpi CBS 119687]
MDDLDDDLDLRYHRGLKPDVYYRCPTTESLDGALRNELERNASSLIPVEIVTEFIFAAASTITIPVTQQHSLDALIEPANFPQSIAAEYGLCRDIDGKDRLKVQRAVARSILDALQGVDGFKYTERNAHNREGGDGARFKYVCQDSLQNKNRKSNKKKESDPELDDSEDDLKKKKELLPTYDCGGAIHIKFSLKREAIHVVYKHSPIHRDVEDRSVDGESKLPALSIEGSAAPQACVPEVLTKAKPRKRKRSRKDEVEVEEYPDLDMSTSPEASKTPAKKRGNKAASLASTQKPIKKGKKAATPTKPKQKVTVPDPTPPPKPAKGKTCVRCREKKIKCNEAKPTCNQCKRGLWACQYDIAGSKKRSKNGCVNCKQRKRKCTEEQPSCAYCLKVDDDCAYDNFY